VYEEGNFPSVRYLYQAQPELDVVVVPDDQAIVEAIDERTLLVPITHVLFKTAEIQDVAAIVRRAHEVGAHVVLDAYQSAGIVPLDVTALNVDFAVGGSVKWLCGGPGNGWLYVRPDLAAVLEPTFMGWQAHARPFGFEPELEYAEGATRFLTGTPNVPALYAATAGYDLIEEIGVDRIRKSSIRQTQLLIDLLDDAGFEVGSPRDPARRGGTVTVRTPEFEAVHKELAERQILCDFRPDAGLRLGPHYYNTDDELRFVVEQISAIVETRAYERHLGAAARF
jgi:kynureninase